MPVLTVMQPRVQRHWADRCVQAADRGGQQPQCPREKIICEGVWSRRHGSDNALVGKPACPRACEDDPVALLHNRPALAVDSMLRLRRCLRQPDEL